MSFYYNISHSLPTFFCITFFHFSLPIFPLIDTFGDHVVLASATISDKIQNKDVSSLDFLATSLNA